MHTPIPHWDTFRDSDDYRLASDSLLHDVLDHSDTSELDENNDNTPYILALLKCATARDVYFKLQKKEEGKGKGYSIRASIGSAIQLMDESHAPIEEQRSVIYPVEPAFLHRLPTRGQKIAAVTAAYSLTEKGLVTELERSTHPEIQGPYSQELAKIRKRYTQLYAKWMQYS